MDDEAYGPDGDVSQESEHGDDEDCVVQMARTSLVRPVHELIDDEQKSQEYTAKPGELRFEERERLVPAPGSEPILLVGHVQHRNWQCRNKPRNTESQQQAHSEQNYLQSKKLRLRLPSICRAVASKVRRNHRRHRSEEHRVG